MNTFMNLLTSQLKNQDPLSPMDSSEFTNQLVLFAQVEQQISQNQNLEDLIAINQANQAVQALGYIDQRVEAISNRLPLQNGEAEFTYNLETKADSVGIVIRDDTGQVVKSYTEKNVDVGVHNITWDGKDSDGNQLDDGTYDITVTALDDETGSLDTFTTVFGVVEGVATQNGATILALGETPINLADVISVRKTADIVPPGTGDGGNGDGAGSAPDDDAPADDA
jgi:flagellar basal-body rod modification protein FlgD